MLRVDESRYSASLLRLGNGMDGKRCLTGALRSVYLNDSSARIAPHTKSRVKGYASCRDDLDVLYMFVTKFHDRPLTEVFLYLRHCRLKSFQLALI